MAISLSLVMIGLVSLAPTSSVKRRPANPQTNLSTSWKAKTGTFTTIQVEMDGALQEKNACLVKKKADITLRVSIFLNA